MTPTEVEELTARWTSAQRTVAAFVRSLVIDFHESEDVLQRVAVTLVRRYAQYDPSRPFLAWAMGVAKLEVVMFLHQRRSDRLVFDDALIEQIAESHERAARESSSLPQFVSECVEELDGRARQAIQLRYGGDLRTSQIARAMQISDGAARTLLSRARSLLRKCVEARTAQWKDMQ
jgi:RNA polymerase sigma-70 factor (ECF subfamily)